MNEKLATVHWEGQGKKGQGQISTETGALKNYPYGFGSRFESERSGTNPEELLGAAHAACFTMAFSFACDKAGFATTRLDTSAKVRLVPQGDGFVIDRISLKLEAEIPAIDEATFQKLASAAKDACPLSKALTGVPEVTLSAALHGNIKAAEAHEEVEKPPVQAEPKAMPVDPSQTAETSPMNPKTHFSFEVQYLAKSITTSELGDEVMKNLGSSLQTRLATLDPAAKVTVGDSHRGSNNQLVELVTTLQDAQISTVLQAFSEQFGVTVSALE